jgi:hypothetical protein
MDPFPAKLGDFSRSLLMGRNGLGRWDDPFFHDDSPVAFYEARVVPSTSAARKRTWRFPPFANRPFRLSEPRAIRTNKGLANPLFPWS